MVVRGQPRIRNAIENRRSGRTFHAQEFKFLDVLFDRHRVAARPPGHDDLLDRHITSGLGQTILKAQRESAVHIVSMTSGEGTYGPAE